MISYYSCDYITLGLFLGGIRKSGGVIISAITDKDREGLACKIDMCDIGKES